MKQSLQFRLSLWLALIIFGVALAAGAFSFLVAFEEANELQDGQLIQVAALVNHHQIGEIELTPKTGTQGTDSEMRVILQSLPSPGATAPSIAPDALDLSANLPDGMQTVTINSETWRVVVKTLDTGSRIAVSQQTKVRDEIPLDPPQ